MRVLIGGGTGFVGRHLKSILLENGFKVTVISRRKGGKDQMTWQDLKQSGIPEDCTAVVNLAGVNILNPLSRWNEGFKKAVWDSRIDTTKLLAEQIQKAAAPPKVFVTMSGISYYLSSPTATYTENSEGGVKEDWLSDLARNWEAAGDLPASCGVRRVTLRSGVILGRDGGMIQKLFYVFYMGAGGRIGSGTQWFPWIHINDTVGIITYAIMNDHVQGVLNGVAPNPVTNAEFTAAFARALWRPAIIPVPEFYMKALFGDVRATMVLGGPKVLPKRTLESGYQYEFPDIDSACKEFAHL